MTFIQMRKLRCRKAKKLSEDLRASVRQRCHLNLCLPARYAKLSNLLLDLKASGQEVVDRQPECLVLQDRSTDDTCCSS